MLELQVRGIVGCDVPLPTYPLWEIPIKALYILYHVGVNMGEQNPQEYLENQLNTMGPTLLGKPPVLLP